MIQEDILALYPDGDAIFHQDSAPSHTSRKTREFLDSEGLNYIKPHRWTPFSPDIAPMDYFVWGYMKSQLRDKKVRTVQGLKNAILSIWDEIPQEMIIKCLSGWPKRIFRLIKSQGKQIE